MVNDVVKPVVRPVATSGGLEWDIGDGNEVLCGICSGLGAIFTRISCEIMCAR